MRLTTQLILMLSLLSMGVLGTTMGLLYFAERQHLLEQVEKNQATALKKLVQVCADSIIDENELARMNNLKTFWSSSEPGLIKNFIFEDFKGDVLFHSDFIRGDLSLYKKKADDAYLEKARQASEMLRQDIEDSGNSVWVLSAPVPVNNRRVGTVAITYDRKALDRLVDKVQRESLKRFLQATLVGVGLSLLFAILFARALSRPIRELSVGADKIGRGALDYRIASDRQDELGDLAHEFNTMAQKLAELDELKDNFLSQITHDLRNPLGAIIGFVEIMLMGIQGALNPDQVKSLQTVSRNANYLKDLINNILDLTKLEAGKMEIIQKPVNLKEVADSVAELMKVKADEFKVRLTVSPIPPDLTVWSDEQEVKRVLLNLVSNSLKFTPEGGTVFVEWSGADPKADRIAVRDTGIGIPADKLHTLFQKFSQIAETKDKVRASKGTGLGLVICKQIVEAQGGRIWVESEYKRGTTFFFTLPKEPAGARAPTTEETHAG